MEDDGVTENSAIAKRQYNPKIGWLLCPKHFVAAIDSTTTTISKRNEPTS
jgi:hypothetical protein